MSSDGLAKVTYLFGATAPANPSEAPAAPGDRAESRSDRAQPRSSAVSDTDGWYVEPSSGAGAGAGAGAAAGGSVPGGVPHPAPTGDLVATGDRAKSRSDRAKPRSAEPSDPAEPLAPIEPPLAPLETPQPTPKTDLSHLPKFIENPVHEERPSTAELRAEKKSERRASNVSLNALARRGMSSREMELLLERRELEPEDIEAEVARLEGAGLLDDVQLAENLVRTLHERKGLGKSAIAAEMRRRKVDDAAISGALEALDADDELERAIEVAVKRASQLRSYDQETAKRRLSAYLQRRGYGGSVLSAAMKAALEGSSSGPRFS